MEEYKFSDKAANYMKEQLEKTAVVEGAAGETALAIPTKTKGGGIAAVRKKVLEQLGDRSLDDALAEAKGNLKTTEGIRDEAKAMSDAHDKQEAAAIKEFEAAKAEVQEAVNKEAGAAAKVRELKESKKNGGGGLSEGRLTLLEAQKKLAMV